MWSQIPYFESENDGSDGMSEYSKKKKKVSPLHIMKNIKNEAFQ